MKSLTLLVGQYGVGGMSDTFLMLESQGFLAAPINGVSKLGAVIRKNRDSASCATDRDVELLAVDQFRRELRVDIDNNLVNGRALCGVRGRGVPVVNMTEASGRSAQLSATVEPHNRTYRINGFDRREFAVGDAKRPVGRAELYAVTRASIRCSSRKTSTPNSRTGLYSMRRPLPVLMVSTLASRSTASTRP